MTHSRRIRLAEALTTATARLRAAGVESPRLDAEVLLAHVLGISRAAVLTRSDRAITGAERAAFDALISRRARGEPVAYLVGERDWYDLTLRVTPDVLIPRPETEGLLERALVWAHAHTVGVAADIGTGSGALATALARALPWARVYATDLSEEALAVARDNAARSDPAPAIAFLHGDLLAPLPEPVDLIVANLPYIGASEHDALMPDVRDYEPRMALVGGPMGHELIARLLADAPAYLRSPGAIFLELGPPQAAGAHEAAQAAFPAAQVRLEDDYAGLTRYLAIEDS